MKANDRNSDRIRERQARLDGNIFARLPSAYAASRSQGQQLLQQCAGLSIVEWRVLWDLCEGGPMSIADMAAIQRTDHSLLSRALPDMRRKGYVEMTRDAMDGRQTIVAVKPRGRAAYDKAAPVMARRRAALKKTFTQAEIMEIISYLDRLETFLRKPVTAILQEEKTEQPYAEFYGDRDKSAAE